MRIGLLVGLVLWLNLLLYAQAQTSRTPEKHLPKKTATPTPSEDQLRFRLQFQPHDNAAHKQLIDSLEKKRAFRAIVMEDASWVKNNPNDLVALEQLLSYSKVALRDPEFAISQLRSYVDSTSRADDAWNYDNYKDRLAAALVERGRPEEALPLFDELVKLNPKEAGFWADRSEALATLGHQEEAIKSLKTSLDLDPSFESTHEALARLLFKSGDLRGAEAEYRASLSIYVEQYKTGQPTDSLHSFNRQMVAIEAENHEEHALAETRLKLARVLLEEKKYDDAIVAAQAALDADKNQFAALYMKAEIYDAKGELEQAKKLRELASAVVQKETANELKSKNKPAIDPRVLFLMDSLWNEQSGYPAFPSEIVSILKPRDASLSSVERAALATAYFALGQTTEGKQQWEKAITSDRSLDTAAGHYNLGQELIKAGAQRDALPHLQRAYELDPQNTTYRMDYEKTNQRLSSSEPLIH